MVKTKVYAIFENDAVRCQKCGVEIWEGVDCDCGVDGADHEGLTEAYEKKRTQIQKESEKQSEVDKTEFRRLNAKRMKAYRDRKRARKYSPRPSRLLVK
jgi:hypothetical protein